jgi:hypothetical protein
MGRWYTSKKQESDSLKKIEISWLKENDYLVGWRSGSIQWTNRWSNTESTISLTVSMLSDHDMYAHFSYSQIEANDEKKNFDYKIPITSTACHFGGKRYWFICTLYKNNVYCGKRVGVLYKAGDYFGCRHCYNLTYNSRNENRRFKDYPLFNVLGSYAKIDKMEERIKRKIYAGKTTRKQRTLERMYARMLPYAFSVSEMIDKKEEAGI